MTWLMEWLKSDELKQNNNYSISRESLYIGWGIKMFPRSFSTWFLNLYWNQKIIATEKLLSDMLLIENENGHCNSTNIFTCENLILMDSGRFHQGRYSYFLEIKKKKKECLIQKETFRKKRLYQSNKWKMHNFHYVNCMDLLDFWVHFTFQKFIPEKLLYLKVRHQSGRKILVGFLVFMFFYDAFKK